MEGAGYIMTQPAIAQVLFDVNNTLDYDLIVIATACTLLEYDEIYTDTPVEDHWPCKLSLPETGDRRYPINITRCA